MTSNTQTHLIPASRPPRSKSVDLFTKNLRVEVVELIDIRFKNYPIPQNIQRHQCKYCQLKQKLAKPGEVARCLAHSLDTQPQQQPPSSPRTPPLKPKKSPYQSDGFPLDLNSSMSSVQKLISLSNEICDILSHHHKNINWAQQPELIQGFLKPPQYIPHSHIPKPQPRDTLYPSDTSILHDIESSIQFQLSSFQQSFHRRQPDDSFKTLIDHLLKQAKQSTHIRSQTFTSFIHEVQQKLRSFQHISQEYQHQIEQLKRSAEKLSTEHSLKQFSDELNCMDRFSELGDMSLKDGRSVCMMCRHRVERMNDDLAHMILAQAHTLETLMLN